MNQDQFNALLAALDHTKWTDVVSAIILLLTFIAGIAALLYARKQVLFAREQVLYARKAMDADHQRSRRQLAIEMCTRWSGYASPETTSIVRLVEKMNSGQCEALALTQKLSIGVENKHHLLSILQLRFSDIADKLEGLRKNEVYEIDNPYLVYMRYIAVRYLNLLESILLSWTLGVADKAVIEKEFAYLCDPKTGRTAMEGLRTKLGMEAFPAIEEFVKTLRAQAASSKSEVLRPQLTE